MSDSSIKQTSLSWVEPTEAEWEAFVETQPNGDVLQLPAWAHTKQPLWQVKRLALRHTQKGLVAGAQVLLRALPFPFHRSFMGYIPRGPILDWADESLRSFFLRGLTQQARNWGCISLTMDPALLRTDWEAVLLPNLRKLGFSHAGFGYEMEEIQPRFCRILFLGNEEETEAVRNKRFFPNTRNLIRRAQRLPFQFVDLHAGELDAFWTLMQETGKRDHIGVRNQAYYDRLLHSFSAHNRVDCLLATLDRQAALEDNHKQIQQQEQALKRVQGKRSRNADAYARLEEEERSCQKALANLQEQAQELEAASEDSIPLACALLLYCGKRCTYLYGGSSDRLRSTAPVYALLPEAFRRAQARGCTEFDFGGVSGIADPAQDPAHGGLTIFKRQWDTEEIEWIGEFRISLSPIRDALLQTLVRWRKRLRRPGKH